MDASAHSILTMQTEEQVNSDGQTAGPTDGSLTTELIKFIKQGQLTESFTPQPTSKPTSSHWEKLDKLIGYSVEPLGPEWFTTEQYAKRYDLGNAAAYRQCMDLMNDGVLECWFGISFAGRRKMRKWRIKKKTTDETPSSDGQLPS